MGCILAAGQEIILSLTTPLMKIPMVFIFPVVPLISPETYFTLIPLPILVSAIFLMMILVLPPLITGIRP